MKKYTKITLQRVLEDEEFETHISIEDLLKQCVRIKKKYPDKKVYLVEGNYYNDPIYFAYDEIETDEAFNNCIKGIEAQQRYEEDLRKREETRKKDLEEFHKLKRKLGMF